MIIDAVFEYHGMGYSVIPLRTGDKVPALASWKQYQSEPMGSGELREFWAESPDANVAVITGKISGVTVIDIDRGGVDSLKEAGVALPKTYTVKSPHGYHYWYLYSPELKQGSGILDGVDIRNDGGYIAAVPSRITKCDKDWCSLPADQHIYKLVRDMPLASFGDIPEVLKQPVKRIAEEVQATFKHPMWVSEALATDPQEAVGRRNDLATRLAGYFRQKGLPADVMLEILRPWQQRLTLPDDPYSERELTTTINSVCTKFPVGQNTTYVGETVEKPLVSCDEYGVVNVMFPEIGVRVEMWDTKKSGYKFDCLINIWSSHLNSRIVGPIHMDSQSGSSRAAIRGLSNKSQTENWDSILQQAGAEAQTLLSKQSKPIPLSLSTAEVDNSWLVSPLIHGSLPTILVAHGDIGKSTIALALGLSVASGYNVLPPADPTRIAPVLYYDWELNEAETRARYRSIAEGAGIVLTPEMDLHYTRCYSSMVDIISQARSDVRGTKAGLVIIDSLVPALNDEANSPEAARGFFNAIATLKVPVLIITHVSKTDEDSGRPFGSVFFWNLARNIWQVKKQQDIGSDEMLMGIHHVKSNVSKKYPPIGISVTYGPNSIVFGATDVRETPEISSEYTIDKIESALTTGSLTLSELAQRTGVNFNTVSSTVKRHEGKRLLRIPDKRNGEQLWGLKA